ncbi:GPI-anchored surface protein, putative [Bodo saltans]|uniref:GPI-anchored surface protein, putative n=1 Tax=Bodo saltans TaxID=75058 RepID=A0A0S4IXA7_BODSA|nr:GPI-anchored surface protein, putative [Bodo saltans]|eukprot:CUG38022.1 GPI-anchored surface protein, putative [Bodo saltans]
MTERNRAEAADDQEKIGIRFSMVTAALPDEVDAVPYQRFVASLKTLFSDFVVREQSAVVESGKPLQLTTFKLAVGDAPHSGEPSSSSAHEAETGKRTPAALEATVREVFTPLIGAEDTENLVALTEASFSEEPSELTFITLQPITDKAATVKRARSPHTCIKPIALSSLHTLQGKLGFNSALRMVAQQLGLNAKCLMFSGTKDKRGVTLQRVACRGLDVQKLLRVNRNQFGRNAKLKVGNMELRKEGLTLGDLVGNTFEIVLRVVKSGDDEGSSLNRVALDGAVRRLQKYGFPNFFGPPSKASSGIWSPQSGYPPRGQCRWGDLVAAVSGQQLAAAEDGGDDAAGQPDGGNIAKEKLIAVRRLTQDDIASGTYSIKDVLLTVPGCDPVLEYPSSTSADRGVFEELIGSVGCPELLTDPHDVAKLYHFHGTYRSLVVIPQNISADVREVATFRTPVLETDLEKIYKGWNADKAARVKRAREEEEAKAQEPAAAPEEVQQPEEAAQGDTEIVAEVAEDAQDEIVPPVETAEGGPAALSEANGTPVPEVEVAKQQQPAIPCTAVVVAFGLPPGAYATSLIREICIAVKE